ncbi:MAG: DUF933 domain-containing protein, partial [Planctomycetia bacterium]|nr:DUF933 domain-containing protein [Planctomycetia bacterium]
MQRTKNRREYLFDTVIFSYSDAKPGADRMKIGLVGYQGAGKSTCFQWLTGQTPDPAASHTLQNAMCPVPESRVRPLCELYHPRKITLASLEIVDTPGLARDGQGNAGRLSQLRECGCLVLVVPGYDRDDPIDDLRRFEDDLILADMEIVARRLERISEQMKKPVQKTLRDQLEIENATLSAMMEGLDSGKPVELDSLNDEQQKVLRAFQLMTAKPRLVLINTADDENQPEKFLTKIPQNVVAFAAPVRLELELGEMTSEERTLFIEEMGLGDAADRDGLIRAIMDVSGQQLFLTAGEKEVRTWMMRKGGTALEAAETIHSDLARG